MLKFKLTHLYIFFQIPWKLGWSLFFWTGANYQADWGLATADITINGVGEKEQTKSIAAHIWRRTYRRCGYWWQRISWGLLALFMAMDRQKFIILSWILIVFMIICPNVWKWSDILGALCNVFTLRHALFSFQRKTHFWIVIGLKH